MAMKTESIIRENPSKIARSPFNRQVDMKSEKAKELIESIRSKGIIQPLIVRPGTNGKAYELIAGERRWRAALVLQLPEVPILIRDATDTEAMEQQLIENKDREDLSPIEEAEKYNQLVEQYGKEKPAVTGDAAIKRLVEQTGRSKSAIYEMLRLTKLSAPVKAAAVTIPQSHLGQLARLEGDQNAQERVMKRIQKPETWEAEATSTGRVLSFRNTKDLVDMEMRIVKAKKDWTELAAKHKAAGGKVLGDRDSRSNLVNAAGYNYDYSQFGKTYKDLVGKHAPAIVLSHDSRNWSPIYFFNRSEAIAAIEKNGHKKKKNTGSTARRPSRVKTDEQEKQAKEIERIRNERAKATFAEITSKAEKMSGESGFLWTWILEQLELVAGLANVKEIGDRLGIKTSGYYIGKNLHNKLKGKPGKFLRGLTVQALMPDLTDVAGGRCSNGYDEQFVNACKVFGVKVPDYKVELPKVHSSGKLKPKPKPKAKKKKR